MSSASVDTRRLYKYERDHLQMTSPITPIMNLRGLAWEIWKGENRKAEFPHIFCRKGLWYLGQWFSYCDMNVIPRLIVLTSSQCKPTILVHELVHAMGFEKHDKAFVRRYFYLLEKYCGYKHEQLVMDAAWFGVKA